MIILEIHFRSINQDGSKFQANLMLLLTLKGELSDPLLVFPAPDVCLPFAG